MDQLVNNYVRSRRKKLGRTLEWVSKRSGVPVTTISEVERGRLPNVLTALYLARALGTTVEQLWPLPPTSANIK